MQGGNEGGMGKIKERGPASRVLSKVSGFLIRFICQLTNLFIEQPGNIGKKVILDIYQALYKQMLVACITYDFHPMEDGRLVVI